MTGGISLGIESKSQYSILRNVLYSPCAVRYQRAYVDFFEDELVRYGYDWKRVVHEFLFSGKEPLINSVLADRTLSRLYTLS